MKVSAVYFSPTGNSKKTALAAATAVASAVKEEAVPIDVTVKGKELEFGEEDFVVFGAPVYAGRIPVICRERFELIKGNNTPCVIIGTYGNRAFDDALLEMADMFSEQGFVIKGAAGVVGRHTYGEIQVGRPDENDLNDCREFAVKVLEKNASWPEFEIPGNRPYRDGVTKGSHHPLTDDKCVSCGLCVKICPAAAIGEDCETVSDNCISCFRCIRSCPVGAKNMNTEAYNKFAADFTERLKERKENEFFF